MALALLTLTTLACRPADAPRDAGVRGLQDGGREVVLGRCPTTGAGAMEGDVCFTVTPAEAGLPAEGSGATVPQYALRPPANARGQLVLFFNGSGGSPRAGTGTSAGSFYGVARAQGFHVLAVSYLSGTAVGSLCRNDDACFEPTRATILTGIEQPGASTSLGEVAPDEGVFERVVATLRLLEAGDPMGGWARYLDASVTGDAERAIRWESVVVSGHSQGGGHAALIAKRQKVARAVMLASPCDGDGAAVASWLSSATGWKTPPSDLRGLWTVGDTTCPRAPETWRALGMAASARRDDGPLCAGETAHAAPLRCASNASTWATMLTQ